MKLNVSLIAMTLLIATCVTAENPAPPAFPKGTLSFQTYGSYESGLGAYSNAASGGAGAGYYVLDNLSLSLEANGYRVTQSPARNAWMYGLSGALRHHVLQFDRSTLFIDASFGPVEATGRVPAAAPISISSPARVWARRSNFANICTCSGAFDISTSPTPASKVRSATPASTASKDSSD